MLYNKFEPHFFLLHSTIFSKASVGSAIGAFLYFLAYFPYLFTAGTLSNYSRSEKLAMCLASPSCVGLGASILSTLESEGVGLTTSTINTQVSVGDPFVMGDVFGMLIFDIFLYLIIAWFAELLFN